jgi:dolichol-phosphate mannosyltransferase
MIIVLLPAYNEEKSLPELFPALDEAFKPIGEYRIVIVDDGSSDKTPEILESMKSRYHLTVLTHPTNMNLGRAMLTGLSYVRDNVPDDNLIITMDADNTHSPSVIHDLIKNADKGDIGIASRYQEGGGEKGLSGFRSVMSRGAGFLLDLVFKVPNVRDYTCGFRLYHPAIIKRGFSQFGDDLVSETGFSAMAEILLRLSFVGATFYEVPLLLRYDLKGSPSKMKVFRTIIRYLKLISKLQKAKRSIK